MRQKRREASGCIITGNIDDISEIENCIRKTKKYTKGAFRKRIDYPIQGEEFPSKMHSDYYEVYPDVEVRDGAIWDLAASVAWAWVWGDVRHIDVIFQYDFRANEASMMVRDGPDAVKELVAAIPKFGKAVEDAKKHKKELSEALEKSTENKVEVVAHG